MFASTGITIGDELGTTISFGFRAPDIRSLSTALWDEAVSTVPAERAFYQDGADLDAVPLSAGKIADRAVHSIASRVQSMVSTSPLLVALFLLLFEPLHTPGNV
jgi:hypothetical protein